MDLLRQFPALWAIAGMIVTGIVFWVTSRKVLILQGVAAENLSKTLDRQIVALEKERDHYRENLHTERNAHQNARLVIKDLEQRPDLTSIATLIADLKEWMKKLEESLSRLPAEMQKMSNAFDERQAAALAKIHNGD